MGIELYLYAVEIELLEVVEGILQKDFAFGLWEESLSAIIRRILIDLVDLIVPAWVVGQIHGCLVVSQQLLCVVRISYTGYHIRVHSQGSTLIF